MEEFLSILATASVSVLSMSSGLCAVLAGRGHRARQGSDPLQPGLAGRGWVGGCTAQLRRGNIHTSCRRSNYYTYLPLGCGSKTPLISVRLPQRPAGLPVLTSQSAFRLSITTSLWVSSSQRSRKSCSSSGSSSPILSRHPSTQPSTYLSSSANPR